MAKKKKNQTSPPAPTHPNLMEGKRMTKKRKIHTSTLNKCSSNANPCTNKTGSYSTHSHRSKTMTKKRKNPIIPAAPTHPGLMEGKRMSKKRMIQTSTLNKCSSSSSTNSCNNKTRSFTTVVKHKTTITTTITTTTILQAEDNMDKDTSLYICVLKNAPNKDTTDSLHIFTWFKLDPEARTSTKGVPLQPLTPLCQMPGSTPRCFQAVVFGSQIYTLGGFYWKYFHDDGRKAGITERTFSNKVFVCDTLASPPVWKECPSMKSPRNAPAAAAVDGLLYAIGSLDINACHLDPWAEVFHFSSQTWASLPPAPQGSLMTNNSVFAKESGKLVVFSRTRDDLPPVYAFDCKTQSWKNIPISLSNRDNVASYNARSIAVGNMVYTFYKRSLYAMDLSQLEPCVEQVYGLNEGLKKLPDYPGLIVHIVHIGRGKMCLVWDAGSSQRENSIIVYCLKFWVGTSPGESCLQAIIDRCDEYIADGDEITNCLTV